MCLYQDKQKLISMCINLINYSNKLYAESKITLVQYKDLTKLKLQFLQNCNIHIDILI